MTQFLINYFTLEHTLTWVIAKILYKFCYKMTKNRFFRNSNNKLKFCISEVELKC